jgi:hypothetical protein
MRTPVVLLSVWLLSPEPAAPEQDPRNDSENETFQGGFVHLAPGILALPIGRGASSQAQTAVRYAYQWSAGGGFHFEPVPHFLLGVGGTLEHQIHVYETQATYELCFRGGCWEEEGQGGTARAQIDLRIGAGGRWWATFAQLSPSVNLLYLRLRCRNEREEQCSFRERDVGPGIGASLGLMFRPTRRVALGAMSGVDFVRLARRDDPFRSLHTWDLMIFLGLTL